MRIDALAPGGDAIGRQVGGEHDGRATFVALAAPGERVRARLVREKARVAWAELLSVVEGSPAAPARVPAPCPYFGECGGCQWQHIDLAAQRAAKGAIVGRALGVGAVAVEAPVTSGTAYRDRARISVGAGGAVGFRARRDHRSVDVDRCLLLVPQAASALTAIRSRARAWPAGTEIDLQAGNDGVHVAVAVAGGAAPRFVPAAAELLVAWAAAGVVGVRVDGRRAPASYVAAETGAADLAGAREVDVSEPGGPPLRVPAGGFAQVGRAANAMLVRALMSAAEGHTAARVLELHAGSGNFTRHLVAAGATVLASDGDPLAVERGRRNAPAAAWSSRPPRPEEVEAELVVVDPPRSGLDGPSLRAAVRARRRIIYVSCDPQTLGRDARLLAAEGFTVREARAFDLMVHSFHVEVVATFDRI